MRAPRGGTARQAGKASTNVLTRKSGLSSMARKGRLRWAAFLLPKTSSSRGKHGRIPETHSWDSSMGVSIDLKKAHLSRFHGDICAVYTWIDDDRALVLVPWRRAGAPWYIVKENAAYKYDDPAYLAQQCAKACNVLGLEPSKMNWVRVATIIHEGLPDLCSMPSSPPIEYGPAAYGHMQITTEGKVVASDELRLPVNSGAAYG